MKTMLMNVDGLDLASLESTWLLVNMTEVV